MEGGRGWYPFENKRVVRSGELVGKIQTGSRQEKGGGRIVCHKTLIVSSSFKWLKQLKKKNMDRNSRIT